MINTVAIIIIMMNVFTHFLAYFMIQISRSEVFKEVTLELKLTDDHKANIESSLGEYTSIDYDQFITAV